MVLLRIPGIGAQLLWPSALLIGNPKALENPFFIMFPSWAIIADGGVLHAGRRDRFAGGDLRCLLDHQTSDDSLGLLPRSRIVQTSEREVGQIYVPVVNWALFAGVLAAMIGFGSSTTLTFAYGLSVAGTMAITTILTYFVIRHGWGYLLALCVAATGFFLFVDVAFVAACSMKLFQGGWFPLAMGLVLFTPDDDLMMRPRAPQRTRARQQRAGGGLSRRACGRSAAAHRRHWRVPHRAARRRAHGALAQLEAQRRSARARGDPSIETGEHSTRAGRGLHLITDTLGHGFYRVRVHGVHANARHPKGY